MSSSSSGQDSRLHNTPEVHKKSAGQLPGAVETACAVSEVERHGKSDRARRPRVQNPSIVDARIFCRPEAVAVVQRRLLVEHVEDGKIEVKLFVSPFRPVVQVESELMR